MYVKYAPYAMLLVLLGGLFRLLSEATRDCFYLLLYLPIKGAENKNNPFNTVTALLAGID